METKKSKKQKISGILLTPIGVIFIIIGIVLVFVAGLRFAMTMTAAYLFMFSLAFFCVGLGLLVASVWLKKRMKKPEEIRKIEKEEKVRMSTEDMNKRFKRSGSIYFGIGIILIIIGLLFQNIQEKYFPMWGNIGKIFSNLLWVIGGLLLLFGVWYLVNSIRIKKRMKKLEKNEGMKNSEEIKKTELD